jgi:AAA+ superfamily predicted ATPase
MSAVAQYEEQVRLKEPFFLQCIRLRLRRRVLWQQALWAADADARGLAVTPGEVDRILADPAEIEAAEAVFYESNSETRELGQLIRLADMEAEANERWRTLQRVFNLTRQESELFALAAAVAADPPLARACGYLHDDASACYATPFLAGKLFGWSAENRVSPEGMLAHWRLARVPENATFPSAPNTPWVADSIIVSWLLGEPVTDSMLGSAAEFLRAADVAGRECLNPETAHAIQKFIAAVQSDGGPETAPVEIELVGPDGAGKRTLAAQVCAERGIGIMVVDARSLLPKELPPAQTIQRISCAARAARLEQAALYWNHADALEAHTRHLMEGSCPLTFLAAEIPGPAMASTSVARQTFSLGPLTQGQRAQLWRHFTKEPIAQSVSEWNLRPAEIRAASLVASAGPEAVQSACRRMLNHEPGELFTTLKCPYTWDDMVLTEDIRKQLEELRAHAELRCAVLEEWGFERLCPMGRGISALFAGPSGTGKTMAAQVVARSLDRQLCRVDLAEVVNKYIGETEKRLKRVFEACERSAVVLFFDEADALFGQRTQVKDAHDRYANIQIDYLLQRMEQFDGIAILATNRKSDMDSAFMRRLRFIIDFQPPGPEQRLTLWRMALAQRSPGGEELLDTIDWNWLADNLIMTGADIKATVLAAAFLARSQQMKICMSHLLHAARREMSKHGTAWRAGEWSARVS